MGTLAQLWHESSPHTYILLISCDIPRDSISDIKMLNLFSDICGPNRTGKENRHHRRWNRIPYASRAAVFGPLSGTRRKWPKGKKGKPSLHSAAAGKIWSRSNFHPSPVWGGQPEGEMSNSHKRTIEICSNISVLGENFYRPFYGHLGFWGLFSSWWFAPRSRLTSHFKRETSAVITNYLDFIAVLISWPVFSEFFGGCFSSFLDRCIVAVTFLLKSLPVQLKINWV